MKFRKFRVKSRIYYSLVTFFVCLFVLQDSAASISKLDYVGQHCTRINPYQAVSGILLCCSCVSLVLFPLSRLLIWFCKRCQYVVTVYHIHTALHGFIQMCSCNICFCALNWFNTPLGCSVATLFVADTRRKDSWSHTLTSIHCLI